MTLTIVKLGGSVITDKDRPETLDGPALDRAADFIAEAMDGGTIDRLVLVHGGGSFGHHNASERDVSTTKGTREATDVLQIHTAMTTLNGFVLDRLLDREVQAVPVHPFSTAYRDTTGRLSFPSGHVETMLSEGFVPVLHGDLVSHVGEGATVLSGDELVTNLAGDLDVDRIGLCSTVSGVLDESDDVIEHIDSYEAVESVLGGSESTDVTGGMAQKVRTLLDLEGTASIFSLENLDAFLAGECPGTTIGYRSQ